MRQKQGQRAADTLKRGARAVSSKLSAALRGISKAFGRRGSVGKESRAKRLNEAMRRIVSRVRGKAQKTKGEASQAPSNVGKAVKASAAQGRTRKAMPAPGSKPSSRITAGTKTLARKHAPKAPARHLGNADEARTRIAAKKTSRISVPAARPKRTSASIRATGSKRGRR